MDGAVQPSRGEPFGQLYKIVMKKVGKPLVTEQMEPEGVGRIKDQLFQQLQALVATPWEDEEGPPLLTVEEIDVAVDRVCTKAKKAQGLDGIPNSEWTIVQRANPGTLDTVFSTDLKSGVLPTRWKVAQLVLLQIPSKPAENPTLFQLFCMLDTIGKIFEQVLAERLRKHFWGKHALSADQYVFRASCSTIDAAGKLKKLAASAIRKCQFGAAVSLDI